MSQEEPETTPTPSLWTASQRRAICILLVFVGGGLLIQTVRRSVFVPEDRRAHTAHGSRTAGLPSDDGIDPNHADWPTLASIPSLGEKRAQQIVDYRQHFLVTHEAGAVAFRSAADLQRVKGVGAATAANLEPYLTFPPSTAKDRPAPQR